MHPIKQKIIDSATRLFSQKSFYSTSIQEIIEECGIARRMLYKFFISKVVLFTEIFNICYINLIERAESIEQNSLDTKEKLKKSIVFFIEFFMENRYIIHSNILDNKEIAQLKRRLSAWLLNWHKECLLSSYGEALNDNIWDVVIIYRGIQREYLNLILEKNDFFLPIDVAKFMVQRIDAIVKDILETKPSPILTQSIVLEYFADRIDSQFNSSPTTLNDIFDTMLLTVENLHNKIRQNELSQSIHLLSDEIKQAKPRWFLIQALLSHLENEDLLFGLVKQTKNHVRILEKLSHKNDNEDECSELHVQE